MDSMIPDIRQIEKRLVGLNDRKDKVMSISREIIRLAGTSITAMHGHDYGKASADLRSAKSLISKLKAIEGGFEYNALQAHQEFVEANALSSMLKRHRIPSCRELGEGESAYLLGLLDSVGELKRSAFDAIRERREKDADAYYRLMLDIYDSTAGMRFANSLMPDFRRKQDVARMQLESVSSELIRIGR